VISRQVQFLILALAAMLPAPAQNPYGRITGRVTDSAGAVVPNASLRVVRIETTVATSTTSNSEGNFELSNLIPGQYRLTVELAGFKSYERGPLEVRVGDVLNIQVALELGTRTESVTVNTEAPLLESASASVSQVINSRHILDMPTPAGDITYLMQAVPTMISTSPPTQTWTPEARTVVSNLFRQISNTLFSQQRSIFLGGRLTW